MVVIKEESILGSNIYLISDLHFNDKEMVELYCENGQKLRPWNTVKDMNEALCENWIQTVKKSKDKVYLLGDIGKEAEDFEYLHKLPGKKRLIPGNHDMLSLKEYAAYFEFVYSVRVFIDDMILTHIPIHPLCLTKRFGFNVHGHLHEHTLDDLRYLNVCVEKTNFKPIHIEEVRTIIKERQSA